MRGIMIDRLSGHRADNGDVVDHAPDMWKEFADFRLGLSELLEAPLRAKALQLRSLELRELLTLGERLGHGLAIVFGQDGLGVEGFEMGGPASHGEPDHTFGPWSKMAGRKDAGCWIGCGLCPGKQAGIDQRRKCESADAATGVAEKSSAGEVIRHASCWKMSFGASDPA